MKTMMIMAALAAIVLAPIVQQQVRADTDFSIDNSIHINESCKEHCVNNGDIKQEASIDYSQSNDRSRVTDVLIVNGEDLHGHKITFSVDNLQTGAHLDRTVSDQDEYYAKFNWYDGYFPIGTSYKACLFDHKTEDETCKTKSHQQNPDEITIHND